MNNLKKVLALGLALVMLLGMFTIASAATTTKMVASDLSDWDDVEHKDAVALMVDLGIIKGKDTGDFDPTGSIDRASWAKMVFFAKQGNDNADGFLGSATLNDIKGNWAESYISYLKANNYISGDNYGNYNPSNPVTVAEACKMMLTILGYDAEDRGYVGKSWSGNIMADANRLGLMDNVDSGMTAMVPLTRENAAEIVYNALQVNTVEAKTIPTMDGGKAIFEYAKAPTLGYNTFGVIRIEADVTTVTAEGYAEFSTPSYPDGINVKAANLKEIKASADVIGETVSVFVKVTNAKWDDKTGELEPGSVRFDKVISSTVARGAAEADVSRSGGFLWSNVDKVGKAGYVAKFATEEDATYAPANYITKFYWNGEVVADYNAFTAKVASKIWDENDATGRPGVIVDFYLDNNGNIGVVKAYEYTVLQLTGDVETRTTSAGEVEVKVPGITGLTSWTPATRVSGYQGLVEDDVVLYYRTNLGDNTYSYVIEKAEKISGKVSSHNSSAQLTINGSRYKHTGLGLTQVPSDNTLGYAYKGDAGKSFADWAEDSEAEFDFYLDKSGTICFIEQTNDAVSKDRIALVMDAQWDGTDLKSSTGLLQAKLLFIDGSVDVVTVSKLDQNRIVTKNAGNKEVVGGPSLESNYHGDATKAETTGYAIDQLAATYLDSANAAFYNYKVVDGKYELITVVKDAEKDGWDTTSAIADTHVEKKGDFANGEGDYTADSKTTFVVMKGREGEEEFYTYTGFKNVPEMKSATGLAVGTNDNKGVAKYVFLKTVSYSDDAPEGYIFIYNNRWEVDPNSTADEEFYLVNIVDEAGNVTTLSVNEDLKDAISKESTSGITNSWYGTTNKYVGTLIKITDVDEKGHVTGLDVDNAQQIGYMDDLVAIGNDVVRTADDSCDYDNITKLVVIDLSVVNNDVNELLTKQTLEFATAGTFNPDRFFDANTVEATPKADTQKITDAEKAYDLVRVAWICADNSTTADFVYVVRVCW